MTVGVHKSNLDFTWYLLFLGNNETVYIVKKKYKIIIIFFFSFFFYNYKYLCNLAKIIRTL